MSAWTDAVTAAGTPYLWWKLDETSGTTAADASGNGNAGTYSSPTLNQASLIPGDSTGKSVTLATTSGMVSKGSGMSYPNVGVTFAQTFKSSTDFTTGRFFQGGSATYLSWGSTGMIANITTGQTPALAYDPSALCDGVAHFVVYVVRATTVELWVDGTMVASGSHTATNTAQTAFQVKQSFANPTGSFDDVVIWSSALSSTAIGNLYTGWAGTAGSGSVSLAGTRQARTASFAVGTVATVSLAGTRQPRTAAFTVSPIVGVSLAGSLRAKTAAFTVSPIIAASLSGSLARKTADMSLNAVDPGAALTFTFDGDLRAKTSSFALVSVPTLALAGILSAKVSAFAVEAVVSGGDDGIDLSTFVDIFTTTTFDGTSLVGAPPGYGKFFIFPLEFDSATAYTVEVDIEGVEIDFGSGPVMADSGGFLYSSLGPTEDDVNVSNQWTLDGGTTITGGTGTLTFEIGPGVNDWDAAVADGEHYVLFSLGPSNVTAIHVTPPVAGEVAPGTDVVLAGVLQPKIAQFTAYVVAAMVDVPIVAAEHAVVVAQAFGAQSLVNGTQPVYSIEQAYIPRARTRILMGNVDVTYWRNTLTPAPKYTLVEPLLYGPASIDFPQVAACFGDEPGQGDLWFMAPGETVEVQRVLDDVVVGTDYKGVVTDYDIAGRDLTVNIGGELQGRAELVNRQPVIFPRINDLGHQIADAVRDLGLPHFPALGAVTGIETMTVGGTGHLEHIQGLVAKAWTRSGKQWTTMPDAVTGVYETHRKDITTIDGTVFLDDARTVGNLRRDISEEPNRIFVTCVTPAGQRVRFGVYPGLIQGPVPDFPGLMVIGDTGEGVRLLIGKLHATGYLRLKDVAGGFDQDVAFAVLALQADAGLDEDGEVNEATWNALYDLDITGQSLEWASIQPAAQRRKVRKFNRSATGTIMALNPYYEPERLVRDRNIDLGPGVTRDQAREFARTVLHDSDDANWTGTITFKTGALIRGDGYEGMTVTEADVMDAREIRPGMNLSLPQFAGGILTHVSAVEVDAEGTVTATVDTRSRDAMEVWEVIARNRESRNDPSRSRLRKHRSSTIVKDSIGEWDEIGGLLGIDVTLEAGWNTFKVVGAAEGTIARIRIALTEAVEFSCAVFGDDVDAGFLEDIVGNPLTEAGQRAWVRHATRGALKDHWLLYSAGTPVEPCGYGADRKTDDAELIGVHEDEAGFGYESRERTFLTVAVYVRPAGAGAKVEMGRIVWPRLEAGV